MATDKTTTVVDFPNGGFDFKPAISDDQMYKIENKYHSDHIGNGGVARRILLGVLTQNSQRLGEFGRTDPETKERGNMRMSSRSMSPLSTASSFSQI